MATERPTVYVETSVISYLVARPSLSSVRVAANQETTRSGGRPGANDSTSMCQRLLWAKRNAAIPSLLRLAWKLCAGYILRKSHPRHLTSLKH